MTSKEISVFFIGIMLVGFLYLMKHPLSQATDSFTLTQPTKTIGIDIISEQTHTIFNPTTAQTTLESILDIPALTVDLSDHEDHSGEELLAQLNQALEQENYFQPTQNNALFYLLALKAIDEENPLLAEVTTTLNQQLDTQASTAIDNNDEGLLTTTIAKLKTLDKNNQEITSLKSTLASIKTINKLYKQGQQQIQNNQIVSIDSNDAWHTAKQCITIDANNSKSQQLVAQVNSILISNALRAAEETDFQLANSQIQQAQLLSPNSGAVINAVENISGLKQQRYVWLEQQINQAISQVNLSRAKKMESQLKELGLSSSQLSEYQSEINRIETYGKYNPLDSFTDNSASQHDLPTMVVMPTGNYIMGSNNGAKNESPTHQVSIGYGFAVSENEISVKEFTQFIKDTNYKTDAQINNSSKIFDNRTGRLKNKNHINWRHNYIGKKSKTNNPVIHVSWNDAHAYTNWLSDKTNKKYRMLSEAEFEYVLRAGSKSKYPWGDGTPIQITENLTGKKDKAKHNSRNTWKQGFDGYNDKHWGPAPIGSFIPNPFKLNDTAGNVMEWVTDCWHDSYTRAPINGMAWSNPGCQDHVIRGGSWSSAQNDFRSTHRFKARANFTDARLGFRIAVDL